MADTERGWWPDEECDDCDKKGVMFKHWGPLTKGVFKKLCGKCMGKRNDKFMGKTEEKE